MASVNATGWIDVRISVKGENGAEQIQTITPAMYIGEDSAVEEIMTEDENTITEYFNLQGFRIFEPKAGETVICRKGNKVTKIIVR